MCASWIFEGFSYKLDSPPLKVDVIMKFDCIKTIMGVNKKPFLMHTKKKHNYCYSNALCVG